MEQSTILFAPVPKLKDLCSIRCIFSNIQMTHEILREVYHCQTVGCRDIIRQFPKVIASPVPGTQHAIHVIALKKYYETKKLQDYLKWKFINYGEPKEVDFEMYKRCAKYSIIYKLLPVWNKVGSYLCRGQKSSELTNELDAIKFDLDITEEGMFLKFNPVRLKLRPLSLKSIEVAENTVMKFQNTPNICINFEREKAYILPSLNRCKLIKVTKEIPRICPFKDYDTIRDHWKQMYGIVMPKTAEGINYYEVKLRGLENRIFVYPEICLQVSPPEIIECTNQAEITHLFLEDLKVKIPEMCSRELSFNYYIPKSSTNFVKPKEVQRRGNETPSKSTIVRNPCFSSTSSNLSVFNYDAKTYRNFSFQLNFDSPTKSQDGSSTSSFSFQNKMPTNGLKVVEAETGSKIEFVKDWLSNSCASPASTIDSDSQQSRDDFQKPRESPLKKKIRLVKDEDSFIRSIETVKIPLARFKKEP